MGGTHILVTGVWVGGDERSIHFPSWAFGQGGKTARPIWAKFMLKTYADPLTGIVKGRFRVPRSGVGDMPDCSQDQSVDSLQVDVKSFDIQN